MKVVMPWPMARPTSRRNTGRMILTRVSIPSSRPPRDCGMYSSGNPLTTAAEYRAWIRRLAQGLRGTRALVVLEPDALPGSGLPDVRQVTFGTTLVIDWETRRVRSLLTSDRKPSRKTDRDGMLRRLMDEDLLRVGEEALGPDGKPLCHAVQAEVSGGILRVVGTAHMLHLVADRFQNGGG